MADINDRAVQELIGNAWEGEWDDPITKEDLADAVALVLRVFRDDMVMAWDRGQIRDSVLDVERMLNDRIRAVSGRNTITGDTT